MTEAAQQADAFLDRAGTAESEQASAASERMLVLEPNRAEERVTQEPAHGCNARCDAGPHAGNQPRGLGGAAMRSTNMVW